MTNIEGDFDLEIARVVAYVCADSLDTGRFPVHTSFNVSHYFCNTPPYRVHIFAKHTSLPFTSNLSTLIDSLLCAGIE